MNFLLIHGDKIKGRDVIIIEGKTTSMAQEIPKDKNAEEPARESYPAEFLQHVTGHYYSTIEQLYESWLRLQVNK